MNRSARRPVAWLALPALAACTATAPPGPAPRSSTTIAPPGTSGASTVPPPVAAGLPRGYSPGADTAGDAYWSESAPMASYLATVAIGEYRVTTGMWHGLPMVLAVAAAASTLDDVALENQTRPVYAMGMLNPSSSGSTKLLAHELAHQWYGDDVSVADWRDARLNEGFATYAEWLWTEHQGGASAKDEFDTAYRGLLPDPPAAPRDTSAVFGRSAYLRGAATLGALRIAVGDDTFWRIMRGWPVAERFGNATTADFIAYADKVSGRSLDGFLHRWLYEAGTPPYPEPVPRP